MSNPNSCWILCEKPRMIINEQVEFFNEYEKDVVTIQKVSSKINLISSIIYLLDKSALNINVISNINSEIASIVLDKLLSTGLFSQAVELCVHQELEMSTFFKALTRRCISTQQCNTKNNLTESVNSVNLFLDNGNSFQDLAFSLSRTNCKEGDSYSSEGVLAASTKCWDFLKNLLRKFDSFDVSSKAIKYIGNGHYRACVVETMLLLSFELPDWLFSSFIVFFKVFFFHFFRLKMKLLTFLFSNY